MATKDVKRENIPVIDFQRCGLFGDTVSDAVLKEIGEQIIQVYKTVGFLYLKNHGITDEMVGKLFSVSHAFFNLPVDTKGKYAKPKDADHGWVGPEREGLNPERPPDKKESYNYQPKSSIKTWPNSELPKFKATFEDFFGKCAKLTLKIMEAIAHGLDIEPNIIADSFKNMGTANNTTALKANWYPMVNEYHKLLPNQLSCSEHTDFGGITLLFQDCVGGLQVEVDGDYVDVPPLPGTVVVNIGVLMQRWTGDQLIASPHRVSLPTEQMNYQKARQSIAFFANPDDDVIITCLDGSVKYKPIKTLDYILQRLNEAYLGGHAAKDYTKE